tara:strand:+ start:2824 stop:3498 length:675 start_codon:yes stop_codon:yes gene_type:complete
MTYEEAQLRSDIAHENFTLQKLIEAGESLMGDEQQTMGILGLVGKVLGSIFGGPIGGAVGEASGRFIGDSLYEDYKIDPNQFKFARPTAAKASREFRDFYNDMSNQQWADFAANIGMAYIQAGGLEGGEFHNPTEIDWSTYGNQLPTGEEVANLPDGGLSEVNTFDARSSLSAWEEFSNFDWEGSGTIVEGTSLFGVGEDMVSRVEFMTNPLYYEMGLVEGLFK